MITALPTVGRFIVDTEVDMWDVDVTARLAIWHDLHTESLGVHVEPEPFMFSTVEAVVGNALIFDAFDGPRVSARVVGITPHTADVAA